MVKDRKIFSFEEKFLKDKDFLSITTITEGHGLTPDTFKNKNHTEIFVDSFFYSNGEVILDYICKLKSGIYFYFSKIDIHSNYKLKAYYSIEQRSELNFLIKNILKQSKNETDNIRGNTEETKQ
jgi:hypothetical protein